MKKSIEIKDKNSLFYWYPKIKNLCTNIPKTEYIAVSNEALWLMLDGDFKPFNAYKEDILKTAKQIGYPLFLRTDLTSGKHDFTNTCYVQKQADLLQHIFNLAEFSALASFTGLNTSGIVFREFVEMNWSFRAFSGLPIGKERRYFIRDGMIECHHPYWPIEAFQKGYHKTSLPEDWENILIELNKETEEEVLFLSQQAKMVASVMPGFWSVDFCQDRNGTWWLIDMAQGEDSWHPKCEKTGKKAK